MPAWISYNEPPIQELIVSDMLAHKIKLLVRREDMNHRFVAGNKWWKLKGNLMEAVSQNNNTVLTFGGAFSNHIHATAAACQELNLKSIGVIRGEKILPLNSTLAFAEECGMQFHFVSRADYKRKSEPDFLQALRKKFGDCFIIPEGGTNALAVRGCEELGKKLLDQEFDYLCLPVGTGGTMAGIINGFGGKRKIIGVPVLKDGGFLRDEIQTFASGKFQNWQLLLEYHQGGYAKSNAKLDLFIQEMHQYGIPTEHVYSAKLFWAVMDLIKKGFFEAGSTVMILHTGGLRTPRTGG